MDPLWEEIILLMFVVASVPAFVYALEKIKGRQVVDRRFILTLYIIIFYTHLVNVEKVHRGIEDDYDPFFLTKSLKKIFSPR